MRRTFVVLAVAATGLVAIPNAASADDPCTIIGTEGNDVLSGTPGPDVVCALGGDDTIEGLGGDDILYGGPGRDLIRGGDGNDLVVGGDGRDTLIGNTGDDTLVGQDGDDFLDGGQGDDTLYGAAGDDRMFGGSGSDLMIGGDGSDHTWSSNPTTTERTYNFHDGGSGFDVLHGSDGVDQFLAGRDGARMFGRRGHDRVGYWNAAAPVSGPVHYVGDEDGPSPRWASRDIVRLMPFPGEAMGPTVLELGRDDDLVEIDLGPGTGLGLVGGLSIDNPYGSSTIRVDLGRRRIDSMNVDLYGGWPSVEITGEGQESGAGFDRGLSIDGAVDTSTIRLSGFEVVGTFIYAASSGRGSVTIDDIAFREVLRFDTSWGPDDITFTDNHCAVVPYIRTGGQDDRITLDGPCVVHLDAGAGFDTLIHAGATVYPDGLPTVERIESEVIPPR